MKAVATWSVALATLALALPTGTGATLAQDWPTKGIIRIIAPFPPGGVLDGITRSVAERLRPLLNQSVILENKGGAGGTIGLEACQKAEPDGYTFCATTIEHMTSRVWLEPDQFEKYKDVFPVMQMMRSKGVVYARSDLPANSIAELVKLSASQPGKLNYASFGQGSAPQLFFEWLNTVNKIDLFHIPMRSAAEIMNETIAGRMDVSYVTVGFANPFIEAGKIKALAVLGRARSPLLPNTPSLAELGLDYPYEGGWFALMSPPGIPAPITQAFVTATQTVLRSKEYNDAFLGPQNYEAIANTPSEFAVALKADTEKARMLVEMMSARQSK